MHDYPYPAHPSDPTMKQVWLAAFVALLGRMSPDDAEVAADRALVIAGGRWSTPVKVRTWDWAHNFPLGYRFELSNLEPWDSRRTGDIDPGAPSPPLSSRANREA